MKSFTTANLCQEIVFRDQNQNLAPNSSQLLGPEQTTVMRPARTARADRNRMAKAARFWPIDLPNRLEPSNPNQGARLRPRQSAQPVPKTPNQATQPNARPDRSLRSPDPLVRIAYQTRPLGPTLPSRIFRPGHAAWTESPSLAESNRLTWLSLTVQPCVTQPGRSMPRIHPACPRASLHSVPGLPSLWSLALVPFSQACLSCSRQSKKPESRHARIAQEQFVGNAKIGNASYALQR